MHTRPLADIQCFLLDLDGTFNLGGQLIEGSLDFIHTLSRLGKGYLFLTNNSSKSRAQYAEKIRQLGLPIPEEQVLTSGQAAALHLQSRHASRRIYLVGTPALEEEFRRCGLRLDDRDPELAVLGFDTTLTYEKLWKLCDLVRAGLPYIATHPDLNCPTETGPMPDIGATIAFVRASTGREPDLVIGKPNRMIVEAASRMLGLPLRDLAMVGDRLYTDIALGASSGITTCLVLSGETRREDLAASPFQPDYVFENLGAMARWLREDPPPSPPLPPE